jgi:hypothetical protein
MRASIVTIQSQAVRIGVGALALWAGAASPVGADQITDIAMVPRLTIQGTIGATNQIQYTNNLSQGNWAVLTNVVVTQSPYCFVDVTAPPAPQRFYRVVGLLVATCPRSIGRKLGRARRLNNRSGT